MSDIPGENLLKRKKVGTDKKCCFRNCRSNSRYKSYLDCTYYFISLTKPCFEFRKKISIKNVKKDSYICSENNFFPFNILNVIELNYLRTIEM